MSESAPVWKPLERLEYKPCACPVCQSTSGRIRWKKLIRDIEMTYYVCDHCGTLYSNPKATVESLRNLYASSDFFEGGTPGGDHLNYHTFVGAESYLRPTARERVKRIARYVPRGKLLEVASAAGFFLKEAKDHGYDVRGIEFSEPMARWASEKWGVEITPESIELVDLPPQELDVIASWGVLTIVHDPVALIDKFYSALKPGGVWGFNTYYHNGLWPRIVGNRWDILTVNFSQIYTSERIVKLAEERGFRLLYRRRDTPYTDLMKIADKLSQTLGMHWLIPLFQKLGLGELIIKIPLPDVREHLFLKPSCG
jgi:SAM-dependent methyltransferase